MVSRLMASRVTVRSCRTYAAGAALHAGYACWLQHHAGCSSLARLHACRGLKEAALSLLRW